VSISSVHSIHININESHGILHSFSYSLLSSLSNANPCILPTASDPPHLLPTSPPIYPLNTPTTYTQPLGPPTPSSPSPYHFRIHPSPLGLHYFSLPVLIIFQYYSKLSFRHPCRTQLIYCVVPNMLFLVRSGNVELNPRPIPDLLHNFLVAHRHVTLSSYLELSS
jgi:hypothetical protein